MNVLRNFVIGAIAVSASSGFLTPAVYADQAEVGDYVRMLGGDRVGRSGESELDNLTDQSALNFRTFSLHRVSQMGFNNGAGGLRVTDVSDHKRGGGGQLSAQTAYLYTQFRNGDLDQYEYGLGSSDRAETASELQEAIWYLEGQTDSVDGLAAQWVNDANRAVDLGGSWYAQWGNGQGGYDGMSFLGNIRVLNLRNEAHGSILEGSGADVLTMIPAPGALLLGLLGLAGLRAAKRLA